MTKTSSLPSGNHFIPIVTTTQSPPVVKRRIVRPRLIEKLWQAADARLVVIKAPAGYGKTTLAVEWSEELRAAEHRIAWVRGNSEAADRNIFLHYLATAIEDSCPGTGRQALEIIAEEGMAPSHALLTAMINAMSESGEELCLFIDDFHLVESPETCQAFWFLLQHAPRHFHAVLTSREEPALPLGTLHARGELLEIGGDELRFSLEETKRLFQTEDLSGVDDPSILALQRDTGGWVAALRMACSSIRAGVAAEECLRSNKGSGRAVESFLAELLLRLPKPYYEFMLGSSILPSLSADSCNEILSITDSQTILDLLFHRYLLINVDSSQSDAYCYHPLISDYLQQCLFREKPADHVKELCLRAAHWYAQNGNSTEAIRYAVKADRHDLAAHWIEQSAMELLKEGKIRVVLNWRHWLPKDLLLWQLPLRMAIGWSLFLSGRRAEATNWIAEIEADIAGGVLEPNSHVEMECLALRTSIETFSDNLGTALDLGERYQKSPLRDTWIDNVVASCVHYCHVLAGRYELADRMGWLESPPGRGSHAIPAKVYRICVQGLSYSRRLRFADAEACYREASQLAISARGARSSIAAMPAALLAHLFYECDRIDEAEQLIENRLAAINAIGTLDCELHAYIVLVRIAYRKKDNDQAYLLLDQAEGIATMERWPRMQAALLVERLRLFLDEENLAAARNCLVRLDHLTTKVPASNGCVLDHLHGYMHLARAFMNIDEGRFEEVAESLEPIWSSAISGQNNYYAVRAGILQATALFCSQQQSRALARFRDVLSLGMAAGMIRSIVDSGPKVGVLINFASRAAVGEIGGQPVADYVQRLKRAYDSSWSGGEVRSLQQIPATDIFSPREHDVLRLIASGQSNKRVAKELGVSPETIKSHIKNIFSKLQVESRMQAVIHARRLGLLE